MLLFHITYIFYLFIQVATLQSIGAAGLGASGAAAVGAVGGSVGAAVGGVKAWFSRKKDQRNQQIYIELKINYF